MGKFEQPSNLKHILHSNINFMLLRQIDIFVMEDYSLWLYLCIYMQNFMDKFPLKLVFCSPFITF
jgi:hypothetical protein